MGFSNSKPPIFFTHVPKCAGTSIHTILDTKYPSSKFFRTIRGAKRESFLATPSRFLADYEYIGGHLSDFDCVYKVGQAARITTLRDPKSRLQSLMNHVLRAERGEGQETFAAFREGEPKALYEFLQSTYYTGSSILSYFTSDPFLKGVTDQSYSPEVVDAIASRVASNYSVIIDQKEIDQFLGFYSRESRHSISGRRMVGSDLGDYKNFKDMFDEKILALLAPEIRFREKLLELRQPINAVDISRERKSWVLNWDEPVDCNGFALRAIGKSKTSNVKEFTSRPMQQSAASLFVPLDSTARCCFSGLLWFPDPSDISHLRLQLNGDDVPFNSVMLDPKLAFFYGEISGHPGESEWYFEFTEALKSRTVWFIDFCIHAFED